MRAIVCLRLLLFYDVFTAVASVTYSCSSNATCGCSRNSAVLTKIIGGEQAASDTWSWTVSIRRANSHICGGSLISSTLVLTAAHCLVSIRSLSTLSVNVGSKYLSVAGQQRSVSMIYIHRDYDVKLLVNDIAVIRLSSPLDVDDRAIATICLPPASATGYPPSGTSVVAVGWGVLSSGSKLSSNSLQQVTLQTMSTSTSNCRRLVNDNRAQFCAAVSGGGKGMSSEKPSEGCRRMTSAISVLLDTCQGDSGGPLMTFTQGQWLLVGITSYGTGCGLANYPGVYTRVASYRAWISCFLDDDALCMRNTTFSPSMSSSRRASMFCNDVLFLSLCFVIFKLGCE